MVLHRDFMMRMIEQLAAAFFRILAGKSSESPEQAQLEIEDLLADVLGTSREFALGQGPAAIDTVGPALAAQLGRLLLLHGDLSEEIEQPARARRAREMGFRALERALEQPGTEFAQLAAEQLREHFEVLAGVASREALVDACIGAHLVGVESRAWDDAEDWLFFALDLGAREQDVVRGREFYARLAALPQAELEAGGLTNREVADGAGELSRYGNGE